MNESSEFENLNTQKQEALKNTEYISIKPVAEQLSEEVLSLHAQLLNTIEQCVIATDLGGIVIYWNRFAEQLYGWLAEEAIGHNVMELTTPKSSVRQADEIMTQLRQGKSWAGEFIVQRKDGTTFPAQITDSPIYDDKQRLIGIIGLSKDITERKQAEEVLQRSREELEILVKERTTELEKTNKERVEILHQLVTAQEDERKRITYELHDQLGQQMTVLRLKLDILKKMCDNNEELCKQVDETQNVARQLDSDVDFLAWKMRPTVLDDIGIVAALDQYIRQWSAHFNIPTEFDAKRFTKTRLKSEVETNFYRITQEALNNIYKHARASKVNVSLEPRDGSVVLIIEDNGVGFEPGKQISVERGMGLVGMRERAALIGGELEIESTNGAGTTVYVSVPVSRGRREKK